MSFVVCLLLRADAFMAGTSPVMTGAMTEQCAYSALLTSLIFGAAASIRPR
jgi:hypothetical protein